MKKNYFGKNALTALACVCVGIICCASSSDAATKKSDAPAPGGDAGTFIVNRTDSVGSGIDITVLVDGNRVTTLLRGRRYKGTLPAGKHVISVMPEPNTSGQGANKAEVTVEKGHTYSFSAARDKSGKIVLVKSP